jgi:DNA primase
MNRRKVSFLEAIKLLAEQYGIAIPEIDKHSFETMDAEKRQRSLLIKVMGDACEYFQKTLKTSPNAEYARKYLVNRGITNDCVNNFKIGFCDGSCYAHLLKLGHAFDVLIKLGLVNGETAEWGSDKFSKRITFPICDVRGNVIAFGGRLLANAERGAKYINSPETPLFHKGSCLFNIHCANEYAQTKELIVVEGYMDVVAMVQNGFPQTIASLGTALTEAQIEKLWKYSSHPVLCFDGDEAGVSASIRAAFRALPLLYSGKSLFFCYLPSDLDPDDFLQQHGTAAMQQQIESAAPLSSVLWEFLLKKYRADEGARIIPEDRAALKEDIFNTTRLIKNADVREAYNSLFLDQFFSLFRRASSAKTTKYIAASPRKAASEQQNYIFQKILLGILLKVPILLSEVDEFLLRLDFADGELLEIKEWLLGEYFSNVDFDGYDFVKRRDMFLEKIGTDVLKTHAAFLFDGKTTNEMILERWKSIWEHSVENDVLKKDFTQTLGLFKKSFDEGLWNKVRSLSPKSHRSGGDLED